jgi:trehalose 6-phosphate synthase
VNRRFAEALAPLLRPDDVVWVHDYHLIPLGRELRRLGVSNPIGFFLHIPWPARQLFTTLPPSPRPGRGLFAYDLVGMQTDDCVEAFGPTSCTKPGGAEAAGGCTRSGRSTRVEAFPIGLDTDNFLELSRSLAATRSFDRMIAHGRSAR